jgi:hypothetical protein
MDGLPIVIVSVDGLPRDAMVEVEIVGMNNSNIPMMMFNYGHGDFYSDDDDCSHGDNNLKHVRGMQPSSIVEYINSWPVWGSHDVDSNDVDSHDSSWCHDDRRDERVKLSSNNSSNSATTCRHFFISYTYKQLRDCLFMSVSYLRMSLQSIISNHDNAGHDDGHDGDGDQGDGNESKQTVLDRKHHLHMMINQLLSSIYYQFITQQMDVTFIRCMRVFYRRDVVIHEELSHVMTLLLSDIFQSTNTTTTTSTATKIQFILIPVVYITQHYENGNDVVDIDHHHHRHHHHEDHVEGDDNHELSTVLAVTTIAYDVHMIETEKWIYSDNR